ncbi:hypothetical protein GF325_15535 [Candidatus Bathyarchaeota archaeon]|nr:hypothetical protein [Candidatus Bathyarchaeota archaeon]
MKIRPRKRLQLNTYRVTSIIGLLTPVMFLGSIFGYAGYLFQEIPSFGTDESLKPDPSQFIDVNYTRLAEMAEFYDERFEAWHIPINFCVGAKFTDQNYNVCSSYAFSDNGALWTGSAMAGYVGKYLAGIKEGNAILKEDALRVIEKLVQGMSMMLAVPNGGLGPQYGATVARAFASPEHRATIPGCQYLFNMNHFKYFNGTGPYSDWRWSDFTSNDEYGGFYMGLGLAYKFINGTSPLEESIRSTLAVMIDQVCAGMLRSNFLGITGHGGPSGVDQKMLGFQGATWTLLVLKMGALAHPEKYSRLYYHFVAEELHAYFNRESGPQEILSNYFAYNFGMDVVFALLMLEEDPTLLNLYLENFHETIWSNVRYHRNPYFNSMYLAANRFEPGDSLDYELDVEDQLMEFDINHFPDVYQGVEPVPGNYELVNLSRWENFFQNSAIGVMISPLFLEFSLDKDVYNKPLTVKMRKTSIFMWDGNPFHPSSNKIDLLKEEPGVSFTAPYWISRGFCGFIETTGGRT